jgi:hypothetical protein
MDILYYRTKRNKKIGEPIMSKSIVIIETVSNIANLIAPTGVVNLLLTKNLREVHWVLNSKPNSPLWKGAVKNIVDNTEKAISEADSNECQTEYALSSAKNHLQKLKDLLGNY